MAMPATPPFGGFLWIFAIALVGLHAGFARALITSIILSGALAAIWLAVFPITSEIDIDIDIVQSPQQVRIALRNNGIGADAPHEGFGLRSLRERAESLGGSLISGPTTLGGWEVATVLPITEAIA